MHFILYIISSHQLRSIKNLHYWPLLWPYRSLDFFNGIYTLINFLKSKTSLCICTITISFSKSMNTFFSSGKVGQLYAQRNMTHCPCKAAMASCMCPTTMSAFFFHYGHTMIHTMTESLTTRIHVHYYREVLVINCNSSLTKRDFEHLSLIYELVIH